MADLNSPTPLLSVLVAVQSSCINNHVAVLGCSKVQFDLHKVQFDLHTGVGWFLMRSTVQATT